VITSNANIAYTTYANSLVLIKIMRDTLAALIAQPTESNFSSAEQSWLASRKPYDQTEVYRFRTVPIDAVLADGTMGEDDDGPEGRINA
jgi:putative iron-regulated protein